MDAGTILHIPNYHFTDGTSKNKYFLLLKEIDSRQLIVSLPSSIEYFPTGTVTGHGCIEIPNAMQTTYCFQSGVVVCGNTGFSFVKETYLHGCWIQDIDKAAFFQTYPIPGFHYDIKGVLDAQELQNVIECFKNSNSVKRKFQRIL